MVVVFCFVGMIYQMLGSIAHDMFQPHPGDDGKMRADLRMIFGTEVQKMKVIRSDQDINALFAKGALSPSLQQKITHEGGPIAGAPIGTVLFKTTKYWILVTPGGQTVCAYVPAGNDRDRVFHQSELLRQYNKLYPSFLH